MKPLLVVDELGADEASASGRDLARSVEAARLAGFRLFHVPVELPKDVEVADVLVNLETTEAPTPALFLGFIPSAERYELLADGLSAKGYQPVVSPRAHRQILEVDLSAAALGDLCPQSAVITAEDHAVERAKPLGFPVFLKGKVQSLKQHGLEACVAHDVDSLKKLVRLLLQREQHSRGVIVARPLLKLRHVRKSPHGFPLGREYRVVVFRTQVLEVGAYWDGSDSLTHLSASESNAVKDLARSAASRLESPLVGVDIGQDEDGKWWVIETNDPQFMGISHLNPLVMWHRLYEAVQSPDATDEPG